MLAVVMNMMKVQSKIFKKLFPIFMEKMRWKKTANQT
jgi:hypothetical protein